MSHRLVWTALVLGAVVSVVVSAGIATQQIIIGSEEGKWIYRYFRAFSAEALIVGVLAAVGAAALLSLPLPSPGRREWMVVLIWLMTALAVQGFLRSLTHLPFETIFLSDSANSFYSVTQRHDAATVLGEFARIRRESALHAQSNMPGKLILLHALQVFSSRTDVLPWLIVMISNLGGALMYVFTRDLFGDRRIALYAMVLYLFLPGKLLFLPLLNTVTPVLLLGCLCLLTRWLRTGSALIAALLGVALYGLVFFEPLPLVTGLLFAGLAAHALARGMLRPHRFVLQASLMVVAFIATAELMYYATGFNLVTAFRRIGAHAVEFNAIEGRPYSIWIWANLREFVLGTGFCQVALFVAVLFGLTRPQDGLLAATGGVPQAGPLVISLSLLAVLIAVDAIGVNRGEVVRLWIFLACLFQIPAAYACAQTDSPSAIIVVLCTSVLLAAVATSMVGFIVP